MVKAPDNAVLIKSESSNLEKKAKRKSEFSVMAVSTAKLLVFPEKEIAMGRSEALFCAPEIPSPVLTESDEEKGLGFE